MKHNFLQEVSKKDELCDKVEGLMSIIKCHSERSEESVERKLVPFVEDFYPKVSLFSKIFRQNACRIKNKSYLCIRNRERKHSNNGVVVQLVRIPACHAGGRGFESRPYRKKSRGNDTSGLFCCNYRDEGQAFISFLSFLQEEVDLHSLAEASFLVVAFASSWIFSVFLFISLKFKLLNNRKQDCYFLLHFLSSYLHQHIFSFGVVEKISSLRSLASFFSIFRMPSSVR